MKLLTKVFAISLLFSSGAFATSLVPGLPDFSPLIKKVNPAVVTIIVTLKPNAVLLKDLSDATPPRLNKGIPSAPPKQEKDVPAKPHHAEGSGFIISSDGLIVTNAHVVADTTQVIVQLVDNREFEAQVIGYDKAADVAVIKINATNLPTVTIGDSSQLHAGQWVVAIGSPFGFLDTVTAGIVEYSSRFGPVAATPMIQMEVVINPGNSGGPLFDLNGNVVGINSQIYSRTGGYEGVSFAIPINVAMDIEKQLVKTGHVTRGKLGLGITSLKPLVAETIGLDRNYGALIVEVIKNGPGYMAGLREGDVILSLNHEEVESGEQLPWLVAQIAPGSVVDLVFLRDKKQQTVPVTIGKAS